MSTPATIRGMRQKRSAQEDANTAGGRRRLMDAALKLAAEKRSIHALGVRELGREAGLNPNTFYRHFHDFEALGLALIEEFSRDLRAQLRDIRRGADDFHAATAGTVKYVFDFALKNPEAIIVSVREIHGASAPMREALHRLIVNLAEDMVEDVGFRNFAPGLDPTTLMPVAENVVRQIFFLSLDYIERPKERRARLQHTIDFVEMLVAGAMVMRARLMQAAGETAHLEH